MFNVQIQPQTIPVGGDTDTLSTLQTQPDGGWIETNYYYYYYYYQTPCKHTHLVINACT